MESPQLEIYNNGSRDQDSMHIPKEHEDASIHQDQQEVPQQQPVQPPQMVNTPYENQPNEPVLATKSRKFMLTKYTIYVTNQRMYVVGSNGRETLFRILEIDMTVPDKLTVMEDNVYFSRNEIMDVLNGLEESSDGGLTKKITAVALIGFIRFTKHYYLCVVTKRRAVAILGGHYVYHIDSTELIPVANNPKVPDRNSEEARYITTFQNIDLSKTFYYSYNYDITNTLQINFLRNKTYSLGLGSRDLAKTFEYQERFVWNSALLRPIFQSFDRVYDWFQPIIHGFIDQAKISILNQQVYLTLIARRSHHFAGARFFKRGVNDSGDVANEIETEQIVSDMLTTSFNDPQGGFYNNPRYTSFVQHRGSIPLSWSQETAPNIRMTKPPIEINVVDPFYSSSALHFDNLFKRYGAPVQILNLIKQREKTPRETKLLHEFTDCVEYLNSFLPDNKKIEYTAWDMSRASKSRGQDVIHWLEDYSEKTLNTTGFFHNGVTLEKTKLQSGVCRTNCIDCLDRTNTAQFVIGKRALGHQLYALGIIKEKYIEYDSDAINILTEMFHDHGDTIALQYGGSHLVNTLQTYRKINQWQSHSRDIIESVKRFYSNSFVDAQRQDAINLFLGNYTYVKGAPMLWDLNTDYYLHNNYQITNLNYKPSYTHWYTEKHLVNKEEELKLLLERNTPAQTKLLQNLIIAKIDPYPGCFDYYWNTRYIPSELTSISTLLEMNMNSTSRYNPESHQQQASPITQSSAPMSIIGGVFSKENNEEKDSKPIMEDTESIKIRYTSPFKSRKPHREKFVSINEVGEQLNVNDNDTDVDSLRDVKCELNYSKLQRKRVEDLKDNFEFALRREHGKVEKFIKDKGTLPIIDSISDVLPADNAFDYGFTENEYFSKYNSDDDEVIIDDNYYDDNDSSVIMHRHDYDDAASTTDDTLTIYETNWPSITSESLNTYSSSVNIDLKVVALDDTNDVDYNLSTVSLYSPPQVSSSDMKLYEKVIRTSNVLSLNNNNNNTNNYQRVTSSIHIPEYQRVLSDLERRKLEYENHPQKMSPRQMMVVGKVDTNDGFYSFSLAPGDEEDTKEIDTKPFAFGIGGLHNQSADMESPFLQNEVSFDDTVIYNENPLIDKFID